MNLHDITRGNILECVLAAGALLGHAAESYDMERLSYLAQAQQMADAVARLDPVAATVIREGVNRVLHPPGETVIDQTPPTSELESYERPGRAEDDAAGAGSGAGPGVGGEEGGAARP